jgi:hypothetical protein
VEEYDTEAEEEEEEEEEEAVGRPRVIYSLFPNRDASIVSV